MVRTQIYIAPADHRALQREARKKGISMTELVRRIVREHVSGRRGVESFAKEDVLAFMKLGRSGTADTSERHDAALAKAFRDGTLR
jgi:predicted HicB family RNase H-like nuclease